MWSDPQSINRFALAMGALASLALLWCAATWAGSRGMFGLRQVRVVAPLAEVDSGVLESAIRTELRGTFFSVSPQRVRTTLRKLPWVRDLTVRRRWPFALDLDIEEHRAVGYWGDNDLLSDRGEVFRAGSKAPMPRFDGPPGSATDVLSRYREARTALAAHGLDIKVFAMSPRGAITLTTGNDMQIEFGREHYQDRLARFVALYGAWPANFRSGLARIDLRYKAAVAVARNGAALNVESQKGQS